MNKESVKQRTQFKGSEESLRNDLYDQWKKVSKELRQLELKSLEISAWNFKEQKENSQKIDVLNAKWHMLFGLLDKHNII